MPDEEAGTAAPAREGRGPLTGLGLRARLAAFFVAITVVPLGLAAVAVQAPVSREISSRTHAELVAARSATVALLEAERDRAADLATDLTERLATAVAIGALPPDVVSAEDEARTWLDDAAARAVPGRADFVLLADTGGDLVAEVAAPADYAEDDPVPDLGEIATLAAAGEEMTGVIVEVRELREAGVETPVGWLVVGLWADNLLLGDLGVTGGAALVSGERVLAASPPDAAGAVPTVLPEPGRAADVELAGEEVTLTAAPLLEGVEDPMWLVLWTPRYAGPSPLAVGLLVLIPAVLAAGLLGWLLATSVAAPIRRAADAARALASGDLDRKLTAGGGAELTDLATALNTMSDQLSQRLNELSHSRDRLRGSLDRLGQTLSSSLDLNATLAVVVETAMEILGADRGLLLLHTPERDALYLKVGRGLPGPLPRLAVGEGRLGYVAEAAGPVRLPADAAALPPPAPGEPRAEHELIVPLHGRGVVLGVLALLRDDPAGEFSTTDLRTLQSFATQASVAIENVLLHREARRLSVTDSLTGLWNFRYFELQADREVESATRSGRPLSLLIVDIDHFKSVNDDHGHQVGDVVLSEVAARIRNATRTPDVVARYGGEEFVVLLPGTDFGGAVSTGERVRQAVGSTPVPVARIGQPGGRPAPPALAITCSVGVATFPTHGDSVADLLRSADAAMYQAKQRGRNRVVGAQRTGVET